MLFCGDMSVPNKKCCKKLSDSMDSAGMFREQTVIVNLEGVLLGENPTDSFWKVFNDKSILELKDHCGQLIFCLANNHIYDYPKQIKQMLQMLDDAGIKYFGLMDNDRIVPLEFEDNGKPYAIFGHCWEVYTRTNRNNLTTDRIVDCKYGEFYKAVTTYMVDNPQRKVIVYFHWNFDMEEYPFPAYKQLAHDLIDFGVEAVIGNHAHCMHEAELYRGKLIAYGQGNFYMPGGFFFDGMLTYPDKSHQMYIVSVDSNPSGKKLGGVEVDIFRTDCDREKAFELIKKETANTTETNVVLHVAEDYNLEEYKGWYKKNRIKKKLVPVFSTYEDTLITRGKISFCVMRIKAIRSLKMLRDRRKA